MTNTLRAIALLCAFAPAAAATAAPPDELMQRYTAEARAADPGFTGFSAARGETLHRTEHRGGKPDTPACTACHGDDARAAGKTRAGKPIDPIAQSAAPARYRDAAKVEKWFKRNCNEVLGRECTPREKGDWLTYVSTQ